MKLSKLMKALENFEEAPIPESVAAVAEGNTVDPQVVDTGAPVNEPSTIPDAGEMPAGVPEVSPLPIIEAPAPVVAEAPAVVPSAIEGEVIAEEIPLEASGELIIESPMDHDNTMDMMDQTVVETTALSNDLGEIVETHAALEEYARLLKQAGPDGISRQAAGFLRVGLEQFHADGHIDFSKQIASLEDMGEGQKQHLLPSKLKSDTLGSKLKEAAGKIWEWLKKIWEKGKKFVNDLRNGVVGLERKLNAAGKALQKSGGKSQGEFKVPNPSRIAIAGKVNINFPNEIKALVGLSAKVYPERMTQFYNAVASAIGNFNPASGDPSEVMGLLEKAKEVLEDVKFSDKPLPGGVAIDVAESGISYGIKEAEGGEVGETTAQGRSSNIIQSDLKDMGVVLKALKEYPNHYENMASAAEKVGQALERLKKASSGEGMEDGAAKTAEDIESAAGKLLHAANPRGNEIIRYLARTTSAYVDVVLAELKVGKGEESSGSKEVVPA